MKGSELKLDQYLLNLSGLLAIGLCAWVSIRHHGALPSLIVYTLFAVAFMIESFAVPLQVSERVARWCSLAMLLLSFIALATTLDTIALILAVVLMASAPHHFSVRSSWLIMVVANIAYIAIFLLANRPAESFIYSWLTLLALQIFAITSSMAKQREVYAQEELTRKNSELLAARALMARQSKAEERLRIAGDLHDSIGHRLTALQLQLEVLGHETHEQIRPQVETCKTLAKDLLEEVRAIVRQMSQAKSNDLTDAIAELEALTPGLDIEVATPLPNVEPELAQQLVFCVQEATHNAIRHGAATRVKVTYSEPELTITDNGRGLSTKAPKTGFGLRNIQLRLDRFGGNASLAAAPGGGCALTLNLGEPNPGGSLSP